MKQQPTKNQKMEALTEGIKKEMEILTIQHQSSMANMLTALREINKEIKNENN